LPPDQTLLAFDTSAAHCAAALLSRGQIIASVTEPMSKGQAERLMPLLEEVLAGAGMVWRDLDAMAVGTGPGNFTGIRIAVSAARGLALGLGRPAIGVTQFEALAFGLPRPLIVAEDARRGMVYVQGFGAEPQDATLMSVEDVRRFAKDVPATGSAAEVLGGPVLLPASPIAEAIAHVAAAKSAGQPRPAPFYLRAADATPSSDPPPVILDAS
jgi:tRNA threonylcarbamoyladenosine biosynthesis protein TsaB